MKHKFWLKMSCLMVFVIFSSLSCKQNERVIIKEIDPVRPVTPELIEEIVTKEVPQNANKDQVLDFLKKHNIDHSGYKRFKGHILVHGEGKKINQELIQYFIFANTQPRIALRFYFDKNNQLLGHFVYQRGSVDNVWP